MANIRLIEIAGTPTQMGYQHGELFRDEIRMFAEERVHLSGDRDWTGRSLSRQEVLELADACVKAHQAYSPELMEELQGMSEATSLSLSELVIVNGFTDFIDVVYNIGGKKAQAIQANLDNCSAFIVPDQAAEGGHGYYGQTWDMHATATPYVILLRCCPTNAPASLVFTITGCVGMIGMNSAGIAVGINNLMALDGQIGVTWPFVIRKILLQSKIEDALACLTEAKLAGAHNYLLFDKYGKGYNVEAMPTQYHIQELHTDAIAHTNHCLMPNTKAVERTRRAESQANSEKRFARTQELLARSSIKPETLMALTRDPDIYQIPSSPFYVETCGAAIMRPATGDFWAVWGLPPQNEYEHFKV